MTVMGVCFRGYGELCCPSSELVEGYDHLQELAVESSIEMREEKCIAISV